MNSQVNVYPYSINFIRVCLHETHTHSNITIAKYGVYSSVAKSNLPTVVVPNNSMAKRGGAIPVPGQPTG